MKVTGSIISSIREAKVGSRIISGVALLFFSWMSVAPAAASIKDEAVRLSTAKISSQQASTASALQAILNNKLGAIAKKAAMAKAGKRKPDYGAEREAIKDLQAKLLEQDKKTLQAFQADFYHIEKYKLAEAIRQRHDDAQEKFEQEAAGVQARLTAMESTDNKSLPQLAQQLQIYLDSLRPRRADKINPKSLPVKVSDSKVRKPKTNRIELQDLLNPNLKITGTPEFLPLESRVREVDHDELIRVEASVRDGYQNVIAPDSKQVAVIGSMSGLLATAAYMAPTADELAPTEDVQITPEIQALAAQLNHSPLQIYNWVHDNIVFVPSYGSIQGSDLTLQTKKGNDADTASLLIALLRASKIPARYVYGTINVPIASAMNWVGGVATPDAALDLLGQGNIPTLGLAQGGNIMAVQIEHIWAEVYTSFQPGRGTKASGSNTWVSLDASYKQYTYTAGVNFSQNVPFDRQSAAQQIQNNIQISQQQSTAQNVNDATLQQITQSYQSQVQSYVQANNITTVGQLIGTTTIVPSNADVLPSGLPYSVVANAGQISVLPESLREQFQYDLEDGLGDQIFAYTADTVAIAAGGITLTFAPASQSDVNAIASYFPPPNSDGSPVSISQFPTSIPGYAISLVPTLVVNGQVVATGGSLSLGTDLQTTKGYFAPGANAWNLITKTLQAGQTEAIGIDLQGFSPVQLAALQASEAQMQTQIPNVGVDALGFAPTISLLQNAVQILFASNDAKDAFIAPLAGAVTFRAPSMGTFSTVVQPTYSYGVVSSVSFPGLLMDIDEVQYQAIDNSADQTRTIQLIESFGVTVSGLESAVPQQLFNDFLNPSTSTSAIDALRAASDAGQIIFAINQGNVAQILPQLDQSDDVLEDISNSVNAGLQVIISQSTVSSGGWTGVGYIILDPSSGSGAYKIGGNFDGDALKELGELLTLYGWGAGYEAALMLDEVGRQIVDDLFLHHLVAAAFILGLVEIANQCSGDAEFLVILQYSVTVLIGLAIVSLLSVLLGPFALLLLSIVVDLAVDALHEYFIQQSCGGGGMAFMRRYRLRRPISVALA